MAPTVMDRPIATSLHMPRAFNAKFSGGTFASSMCSNISFVPSILRRPASSYPWANYFVAEPSLSYQELTCS